MLYTTFDSSENLEKYHIALVQTIKYENAEENYYGIRFHKAFIFNKDLYKENKNKKACKSKLKLYDEYENEFNYNYHNELIISGVTGIFSLEKKKAKEEDDLNEMDVETFIKYRTVNKYIMKEQISNIDNYDITQVNFKYIAGTIDDFLCIYSKEQHQLTTKLEAPISKNCDSIMYMINEDILCLAGMASITLISIEKFDIVCTYTLVDNLRIKITEICSLPYCNVLVGVQKGKYKNIEYLYQYKFISEIKDKKKEYRLEEVSSKLITENQESNITMRCLSDNKLVTITGCERIQIWE